MFILTKTNEYDWPVIAHVPVDGGTFEPHQFTARFRVVAADEAAEDLGINPLSRPSARQTAGFLRKAWVGWGEDVRDEDGNPLPFSDETRDRMLAIPYVRSAVMQAYGESMQGRAEKN